MRAGGGGGGVVKINPHILNEARVYSYIHTITPSHKSCDEKAGNTRKSELEMQRLHKSKGKCLVTTAILKKGSK